MNVPGRVAKAVGLTEGQVYTTATGLLVAIALLAFGLPGLHDVPPTNAVAASSPLALPGSPAVAEVIAAPDAAPIVTEVGPSVDLVAAPSASPSRSEVGQGAPTTTSTIPGPVAPTTTVEPAAPSGPSPTTTPAPAALGVREGRYATASTPLVPAGAAGEFLPVALRVGSPDKQSYLRLSGEGTSLRLALSTRPGHLVGTVDAVRACRIRSFGWTLEDGAPLTAAPEVDPVDCTLGRPGPDAWTFELGGIDTSNGIALVPVGPTTGSFQIVFTAAATATS